MRAYTDGACRVSNPGICSCAFAVYTEGIDNDPVYSEAKYLGPELHTNNYAEYQGLLLLLRWLEKNSIRGIQIFCDSKLVVNQVMGAWGVNSEELKPFYLEAYSLRVRGHHVLHHIKGHSGDPGNEFVDRLCNEVLDKELGEKK